MYGLKRMNNMDTVLPQAFNSLIVDNFPYTEEELFCLEQYLFLDLDVVKDLFGANYAEFLPELLEVMAKSLSVEKQEMRDAYLMKDWLLVRELAHRAKGGAAMSGSMRLRYACEYLESYHRAGHSRLLEPLYHQVLEVMEDTKQYLERYLFLVGWQQAS
jgi:two-component system aerobic respiration control sensor histidine kinase ArcB